MDELAGRRILTTGSTGYLAANVHALLRPLGASLVRHSRDPALLRPAPPGITTRNVGGDLRRRETWDGLLDGIDVVVHLAGQTSTYVANEDPARDWDANVVPMVALLEACRRRNDPPFIVFAGTATQVGIPTRTPVDEDFADAPVTVYDLHKLTAEGYLETYTRMGFARGTTLRLPNVYGPGPASSSGDRGVLNLMVRRALSGSAVTIYGEGKFVRDYVFVDDVAKAFLAAAAHPDRVGGRHFLLGTGRGHTIAQALSLVARRVEAATGRRVPVEHIATPAGLSPIESRHFVADPHRFQNATGWSADVGLEDGLDRTIRHQLSLLANATP